MNKIIAVEELTSGLAGEKIKTHDVITSPNQPMIAGLSQNDLVTLNNLLEALVSATGGGVDVLIEAGTAYPPIITNGVDFTTSVLRPIVSQKIPHPTIAHAWTNNGAGTIDVPQLNSAEDTLLYITVYTTFATDEFDVSTVDVDTWVRVV